MDKELLTYISIIVSSLTILSYLLAINEYYDSKAYWDFFHIDKIIRTNMRSGFHAEYLSYALVITCFFLIIDGILVYFQEQIEDKYMFLIYYSTICILLFIIAFIALYIIIWKFSLTDINERRIWSNRKQYHQTIRAVYRLSLLRFCFPYLFIVIALYYFSVKKAYPISGILFTVAFIYLQFQNYSQRQQLIVEMKWFDIAKINDKTYVILANKGDMIQMNKCIIMKDILYVFLDDVKILKIDSIDYQTKYFKKFEKICNGAICTKHYKIGYRDDFD